MPERQYDPDRPRGGSGLAGSVVSPTGAAGAVVGSISNANLSGGEVGVASSGVLSVQEPATVEATPDGLPSPQLLSEYERLVPGTAAEFIKLRLQQMELNHRQNAARMELHHQELMTSRRYAMILGVLGVLVAFAGSMLSLLSLRTIGSVTAAEALISVLPGLAGVSSSAYFLNRRKRGPK